MVGLDDQAKAVVGWAAGLDVFAGGLDPDGMTEGRLAVRAYSQQTAGRQEQLGVASYDDGNTYDQVVLASGGANSNW